MVDGNGGEVPASAKAAPPSSAAPDEPNAESKLPTKSPAEIGGAAETTKTPPPANGFYNDAAERFEQDPTQR